MLVVDFLANPFAFESAFLDWAELIFFLAELRALEYLSSSLCAFFKDDFALEVAETARRFAGLRIDFLEAALTAFFALAVAMYFS